VSVSYFLRITKKMADLDRAHALTEKLIKAVSEFRSKRMADWERAAASCRREFHLLLPFLAAGHGGAYPTSHASAPSVSSAS
jgi:hypothetical protein